MEATFTLRHPGTCSGMFWRGDPRSGAKVPSGVPDWPRNGAKLRGVVMELPPGSSLPEGNSKWLEVKSYAQAGSSAFQPVPAGVFMIFDQGGLLLHEAKE